MGRQSSLDLSPLEQSAGAALEALIASLDRREVETLRLVNVPDRLAEWAANTTGCRRSDVIVTGPVDQRVLVIMTSAGEGVIASLSMPLACTPLAGRDIDFATPEANVSVARLTPGAIHRLTRPRVMLVALYHPEVFPLPRFALGISDLARAIRSQLTGQVELIDMQLGAGIEEIIGRIEDDAPDIVGISATFGQHDILSRVVEGMRPLRHKPVAVIGGSLAALNAAHWTGLDPSLLIARGAGEEVMQDVVRHWLGDIPRAGIRGLVNGEGPLFTKRPRQSYSDYVPEIDLLGPTLDAKGVIQLESSRGCTHSCSFCPRDHKGIWSGGESSLFDRLIGHIGSEFDDRPWASRRAFLVDEEFVGLDRDGESLARSTGIATTLQDNGFSFETSSRIDQIYRGNRSREWHIQRIGFWRTLRRKGLDRCLFGVESGVDSILGRFNKKITGEQSAYALRLLTAAGVPIRCTYITFDPLMSMDELIASYRWQGRTDILLRPAPDLSDEELFDAVHDPGFVASQATGAPVYDRISYMLVSMECLIGSPYLKEVEAKGLAGEVELSMGRRRAQYLDPRIGLLSHFAQAWIDRHFSLDYTLKSVEKYVPDAARLPVGDLRNLLKGSAYDTFGAMLQVAVPELGVRAPDPAIAAKADAAAVLWARTDCPAVRGEVIGSLLDHAAAALVGKFQFAFDLIRLELPDTARGLVAREMDVWVGRTGWALINVG